MKPYTLTNREGESISPMTSTRTVFDEKGVDLDTLLEQQRQDADNALKDYAKKTEVTQSLAGKQNKLTPTTDLHITDDNIIGLTEEFKNSKLDKAVWEEKNKQFGLLGILRDTGYQYVTSWVVTPFMIIDKNSDISYDIIMDSNNHIYIQFYDVNFNVIESLWNDGTTSHITGVIEKNDIPSNAVYYRATGLIGHIHRVSNGPTFESREGAVAEAIAASKLALFIDQWNAACGSFGRYNPETGYFELNGLTDITYEEAVKIYQYPLRASFDWRSYLWETPVRTNLMLACTGAGPINCQNMFNHSRIEVIRLPNNVIVGNIDAMLVNCGSLKKVIGIIIMRSSSGQFNSANNTPCESLFLNQVNRSLNMRFFYNLNLESWQYMVTQASNTAAITITVHPNVYAKMTGDTTNAVAAALTAEELAQWQQLLVDAAEKQITFATT